MSEDKKDIEFVESDTQVKEFVSKNTNAQKGKDVISPKKEKLKPHKNKSNLQFDFLKNEKLILCIVLLISIIIYFTISLFVLKLPILTLGIVLLIEAGLAKCLEGLPIWAHCIIFLIQILAGALSQVILFMLLASILYFVFLTVIHKIR